MAISEAGRRILQYGKTADMFARLALEDPTAEQRGLEPWDGLSPRVLTEAHKRFNLGHEGASLNEVDAQIDEQCRRHLYGW